MRFATASETVPEPCQVAGTPLRPFCLGHHLLFKRMGLPFTESPLAEASAEDFVVGIAICAGDSYEATLQAMLAGEWPGMVNRWRRRVTRRAWLWRRSAWKDAELLFRAYLEDGYKRVPVRRRGPGGTASGIEMTAPWEQMLKCELMMGGFSESESLNGYLPGRWYDYYALLELRAAERCKDPSRWRRIFWTESDAGNAEGNG